MLKLLKKIKNVIETLEEWIESRSGDSPDLSGFVDLAPTDKADATGVYTKALLFATQNPNITNIALTGPYGSGKSSIIRTFLKRYNSATLNISLAAFVPEVVDSSAVVTKQEIERSILQQMLYGADANRLPLSRFKRIQTPGKLAVFVSFFTLVGSVATWQVFFKHPEIFDPIFFSKIDGTKIPLLGLLAVSTIFIWVALHYVYIRSMGISLKSISLKDIELTPSDAKEESILNRHLDEIIYFFQSTKYKLVVIEDLDRFNKPDIFVTLREINSLINANAGVHRTVRFLYAIRDNMFENTERTKFFEFIIPVIPIINTSNSIDKVLEHGKRLAIYEKLDSQFLREVSRYLNDLRLIQNIFNEYKIYVSNLEADGESVFNPNKLLAVLIYKNILPSDFEELHKRKGLLAGILDKHVEYIARVETGYKAQINEIEKQILAADAQFPADLQELRAIYAMALIKRLPTHFNAVGIQGQGEVHYGEITSYPAFDQMVDSHNVLVRNAQQGYAAQHVDISGFQKAVNPNKTYLERKQELERTSSDFKERCLKSIKDIRSQIAGLRLAKFNEIIRHELNTSAGLFDIFEENKNLAQYLVLEGYLDNSYYQYTSLFHSGRLSPNDNKFLIQIRSFNNPEPDFQIDNPKEVIAAMRPDDFLQNFVLNKSLVDCLLSNPVTYRDQISKMLEFISSNFGECGAFFEIYYEGGTHIPELLLALIGQWPGFPQAAIANRGNLSHAAYILTQLTLDRLETLKKTDRAFSDFVSDNLPGILALGIDLEPSRLAIIRPDVSNLTSIEAYPSVYRFVTDEGMYKLSVDNIDSIFRCVLGSVNLSDLHSKHYSTVLASANAPLIARIERDFDVYLTEVLLQIDENVSEDTTAVLSIINREQLALEDIEAFVEQQIGKLPSLAEVSRRVQPILLNDQKVEATWENCLTFILNEDFKADILTRFVQGGQSLTQLSKLDIPIEDAVLPLRQYLIGNDDLPNDIYRTYVRKLPRPFPKFPTSIGSDKVRILIDERKITFSMESYERLDNFADLQLPFLVKNIASYLTMADKIPLTDDQREAIIKSDVNDGQKRKIVEAMDIPSFAGLPARCAIVGPVLDRTDVNVPGLTAETAQALVIHSKPIAVQISLFNKLNHHLSDDQVRTTLQALPSPFRDIKPGWSRPQIEGTPKNLELVEWLKRRQLISSWKEATFSDDIVIHNFRS
ncbi:hypothetical protein MMA231_02838 [Asticcacaulis sp. MM231]|uniref:YobI family P-loop NTPase n=1 Tax=Asticcacaulis sp. MM231 TaxID=3157666 RepID=UPI0032D580BE